MIHPGLSYAVHLNGRCIRKRMVSVADIKPFHERPVELRHAFEDEFAHLAWGPDIGLAEVSTAAAPLYTLIDRKVSWIKEDTWVWEYKGRHQDGVESNWLSEEEAQESFTPLQLDVFHALWERYHGADHRARPPGMPTREEKPAASREVALKAFPIGTKVRREFADIRGKRRVFVGKVYDFSDPYWRVRYPDGDWEELNRLEVERGKELATASA